MLCDASRGVGEDEAGTVLAGLRPRRQVEGVVGADHEGVVRGVEFSVPAGQDVASVDGQDDLHAAAGAVGEADLVGLVTEDADRVDAIGLVGAEPTAFRLGKVADDAELHVSSSDVGLSSD